MKGNEEDNGKRIVQKQTLYNRAISMYCGFSCATKVRLTPQVTLFSFLVCVRDIAQLRVHVKGNGIIALESVEDGNGWLKIDNDELSGDVRMHNLDTNKAAVHFWCMGHDHVMCIATKYTHV